MTVKAPRRLGALDVLALGLNAIVGSGIFLFPGTLAALAGPASIAVFLVTALLLSSVALCYAELGGMFRGSGGSYLYAREAFGDGVGYGVGVLAWTAAVLSWCAVASLLAGPYGGAALLAAFGLLNARGVKPAAWSVDLLTLAKLVPLGLFVLLCLPKAESTNFVPFVSGEGRFGYAVFLALWALQGFEVAPVPAGEAADPQRDVPRAVLGSLATAAVLYALVQTAAVGVHPGLAASTDRPLVDAAGAALGPWGARLLEVGGAVSMLGFLAGAALGTPRYLQALGQRHLGRLRLDGIHPGSGTPRRAIAVTTVAAVLLVLLLPSMSLVDLANLAVVTQYLSCAVAVLALRRSRPGAERPYRMPMGPVIAPLAMVVSLWLITQVGWKEWSFGAGVLFLGYVLKGVDENC